MNFKKNFLLILFFVTTKIICIEQAVVIVPVATTVGEAFDIEQEMVENAYTSIPVSWGISQKDKALCPRIHQLLFNEIVTILAERGNQYLVQLNHVQIYNTKNQTLKPGEFWTLKKYCMPLQQLQSQGIPLHAFPRPLQFGSPYAEYPSVVTLRMPHYDSTTNRTYSAGTRFVKVQETTDGYCVVAAFDPAIQQVIKIYLPALICVNQTGKSIERRTQDFVTILRSWATMYQTAVPFVWGGNSLTKFYKKTTAHLVATSSTNEILYYWQPDELMAQPYTGFDSSGLVLRATQLAGIPYFWKNTTTAAHMLKTFTTHDIHFLKEGDILWMPGGFFVISDMNKNKVISALGYQYGYGKVTEISLHDIFENVSTFDTLKSLYSTKEPLVLKNTNGTSRTVTDYKLLKLESVWQ